MKYRWKVVTPTGETIYEGSKPMCKAYIKQALAKGSAPDYLRIEENKGARKP